MFNIEQLFLNILSKTLNQTSFSFEGNTNWNQLYSELSAQALVPLVYPSIKNSISSEENIKEKYTKKYASQLARWYTMMNAQVEITTLLNNHGYDVAILKGTANSVYYPVPQLRSSGDIDFLVRWNEYNEIYNFLTAHKYALVGEKDDCKHHIVFKKNGITFEMHRCPGGSKIDNDPNHKDIINFFQKGLDDIQIKKCIKYDIPVLPEVQNAMVLLLHTKQHMSEGLGFRHILDWMMFAKAVVNDAFWYFELQPWAEKGEVEILAMIMTKMCQNYLGLTTDITWCQNADDSTCDQLLNYLFQQGDFGSKAGEKDKEVRLLTESRGVRSFFKRLKNSSLYSFPLAKKYKILQPVAWIYQLFRYVREFTGRKNSWKKFFKDKEEADNRAKLFENLGI